MFNRACAIALLAAILLQSLMGFGSMSMSHRANELNHLLVHSQDTNHHHHVDNALHMDDEGGSVQHQHADYSSSNNAILIALYSVVADVNAMVPPETKSDLWLSATLEGPLRPPMSYS